MFVCLCVYVFVSLCVCVCVCVCVRARGCVGRMVPPMSIATASMS